MTGVSRRSYLATAASLGAVGFAGCSADGRSDTIYQTSCVDGCQYVDDVALDVNRGPGIAPDLEGFRLSLLFTDPISGAASVEIREQDGELVHADSEAVDGERSVTFQAEFNHSYGAAEIAYAVEVDRA